jgi:hypothetical protein
MFRNPNTSFVILIILSIFIYIDSTHMDTINQIIVDIWYDFWMQIFRITTYFVLYLFLRQVFKKNWEYFWLSNNRWNLKILVIYSQSLQTASFGNTYIISLYIGTCVLICRWGLCILGYLYSYIILYTDITHILVAWIAGYIHKSDKTLFLAKP